MSQGLIKFSFFTFILSGMVIFLAHPAAARTDLADVPMYPQAKTLCDQHVSGNTMHILWRSYSTQDALPAVVAFFEKKLGVKATPGENQSFSLTQATKSNLKIVVYPKTQAKNFPDCQSAPEVSANTIILISEAIQ